MEKAKQQVKIFAIFYGFVGVLNILALIISGTANYVFMALLSFAFALALYNASKDITKYRLALIVAVIVLIVTGYELIGVSVESKAFFYVAESIIELILVFYVIKLLNTFRKEAKEEKKEK